MTQLSSESPPDNLASDTPFHGANEGLVRAWQVLVALLTAMVLFLPWALKPHPGIGIQHGHTRWLMNAAVANLLCVSAFSSYLLLDRRLSRRIAVGSVDAAFLDSVRVSIAVMLMNLLMLTVFLFFVGNLYGKR